MSFPKYPKYKGSGVEWLGEVPEHWGISRLGFESWVRARLGWKGLKADEYVEDGFAFLSTPNIKGRFIDFENVNFINEGRFEESPEIKLRVGDVLLAKDGSTLGTVNVIRDLPYPATVNSSIAVITPGSSLDSLFLYHLFGSAYMDHTIQRVKGGMGVPHLFQADLKKFYMPLPPLPEQTAIAAFLDRETAKIDELVAEQRRLMELLKEKRQAVISHAVTKGLNPDAPMKPSGIEWLGDIPAHWEVVALRHALATIFNGLTANQVDENEDTVPVTRIETISGGVINPSRLGFISISDAREDRRLQRGDILFSNINSLNMIGNCARYIGGKEIYAGMNLLVLRPNPECESDWLFWLIRSAVFREVVESLAKPAINQASISQASINSIRIPIPPRIVQKEVVRFVEAETTKFDTLTAEAQRAIDLLRERRTALISAAVTGKIDVRDVFPKKVSA